MFLSRIQVILAVVSVYILSPIILTLMSLVLTGQQIEVKFLFLIGLGLLFLILFRIGHWEFIGFVFRYFLFILFFLGVWLILASHSNGTQHPLLIIPLGIVDACFLIVLSNILRAGKLPFRYLNLAFPFRGGAFLITDGGNGQASRLVNYHFRASIHAKASTNRSMKYAVDIVKINRLGSSSRGIVPVDNSSYYIYNESVYSPISGTIISIANDIADNVPFGGGYPYNVGNYVCIKNDTNFVVMGHLKAGTIFVSLDQHVNAGDLLARIGNSGLSARPHLHMQVSQANGDQFWLGEGIPLVFDNVVPYKGRVFEV